MLSAPGDGSGAFFIFVLQAHEQATRPALRSIVLGRVVGSVGRYRDFTRAFMPRVSISQNRWIKIEPALSGREGLPPIDVYQIGDVYFVADGNPRVSVARANGFKEIDAYVTVVRVEIDLALEPGEWNDDTSAPERQSPNPREVMDDEELLR